MTDRPSPAKVLVLIVEDEPIVRMCAVDIVQIPVLKFWRPKAATKRCVFSNRFPTFASYSPTSTCPAP